jgi:hypothetical protein
MRRALGVAVAISWLACAAPTPPAPAPEAKALEAVRELTPAELEVLAVEGRVSPHLPIRFGARVSNGNESVGVRWLRFRVHQREVERRVRIAAGEERWVAFQFVFPGDEDWERIDTIDVEWRLVAAGGVEEQEP